MVQALDNLDEVHFNRIRSLIHQRAGIALGDSKRAMVCGRLSRRMRHLGETSLERYLATLDDPQAQEWQGFTNALTTNLTAFFREPHHFEHLAGLMRRARGQARFRIWCAASSSGEEAYSIAMVAAELAGEGPAQVEILATDIDTGVLEKAVAGVYPLERIEGLPKARIRRHFLQGTGPRSGLCRVRPQLQQRVRFSPLNLQAEHWPIDAPLDAIFCRNVMIYFDRPTQRRLVRRMAELLAPGGVLYVGHSEGQFDSADLLRLCARTSYQRLSA